MKEETSLVMKELRAIAVTIAEKAAVAQVADKLTSKGTDFEQLLATGLQRIAVVHGDIVERVGTSAGVTGSKKGDHLVTLCDDDTCGLEGRFVLEAKDSRLSMSKTLAEIDAGLKNHNALAGIAVFARSEQAPTASLPLWYSGNRAIVVFDKENPDPRVLQLAYEWAASDRQTHAERRSGLNRRHR